MRAVLSSHAGPRMAHDPRINRAPPAARSVSRELTQAALDRIAALDDRLHAFSPSPPTWRSKQADAADKRLAAGERRRAGRAGRD